MRRIAVVSSKGTSFFNDMLGTTVGAKSGKTYSAATLSAFGEDLNHHSSTSHFNSFFTGKPAVAGLGHAFLMRNYRAGLAKWQTADPIGYPDGWNALAYCNNGVTSAVDLWGCFYVDYSITVGGSPGSLESAGETTYEISIDKISAATHTIDLEVKINIAYSVCLYDSNRYRSGTEVTYTPHAGLPGGIISENVREAVEAHENGHVDYVVNIICSALMARMMVLETKWADEGWTESELIAEYIKVRDGVNKDFNTAFNNAANEPTINWFNGSPEWRLVDDGKISGKWKWVKE